MFLNLALVAFFISIPSFSAEIVTVELKPFFSFKSLSAFCKERSLNPQYLTLEIDKGTVLKSNLKNMTTHHLTDSTNLTSDEIRSIQIEKDKFGRTWVKNFQLSDKLMGWFLYNIGSPYQDSGRCPPPKYLKSLTSKGAVLSFEQKTTGDKIYYESQVLEISGNYDDNEFFQLKLGFKQSQS